MVFRTRRELESRVFMTRTAQRRTGPHRDPSWLKLILGLSAFMAVAAGCLYLAGWSDT